MHKLANDTLIKERTVPQMAKSQDCRARVGTAVTRRMRMSVDQRRGRIADLVTLLFASAAVITAVAHLLSAAIGS